LNEKTPFSLGAKLLILPLKWKEGNTVWFREVCLSNPIYIGAEPLDVKADGDIIVQPGDDV